MPDDPLWPALDVLMVGSPGEPAALFHEVSTQLTGQDPYGRYENCTLYAGSRFLNLAVEMTRFWSLFRLLIGTHETQAMVRLMAHLRGLISVRHVNREASEVLMVESGCTLGPRVPTTWWGYPVEVPI
mgnify:CR=1 FL=1